MANRPYASGVTGCRCVEGYYYYLPCNLTTLKAQGRSFEGVCSPFFPITRCSDQRLSVCWHSIPATWISWGHWFHPYTSPWRKAVHPDEVRAENTGQFIPSVQLSALYPLSGSHSSPARCPHQGEPCFSGVTDDRDAFPRRSFCKPLLLFSWSVVSDSLWPHGL